MNHGSIPRPSLLIVDDEPAVLAALQRALRKRLGAEVDMVAHTDAILALEAARQRDFDVVISDLRMPEIDGVGFLSLVSAVLPESVRMILTGSADFLTAQTAIQDAGVFRYLTKPWNDDEVALHVRAALAQAQANKAPRLVS
ncbi:MAG TPA: response regulator [Rubrivivax sp.]|nr:response regulator [Rubrivivax sp.]